MQASDSFSDYQAFVIRRMAEAVRCALNNLEPARIGLMIMTAVSARDYPIIQASALFVASVVICANLIVDLLYVYLDPRIRLQ